MFGSDIRQSVFLGVVSQGSLRNSVEVYLTTFSGGRSDATRFRGKRRMYIPVTLLVYLGPTGDEGLVELCSAGTIGYDAGTADTTQTGEHWGCALVGEWVDWDEQRADEVYSRDGGIRSI